MSAGEERDGFGMAASSFAEEALAVAADFALEVHGNGVGAVFSDDVVDAVAQIFDAPAFG